MKHHSPYPNIYAFGISKPIPVVVYLPAEQKKLQSSLQEKDVCSKSIEWVIENKVFSPSYDLAPPPPNPWVSSTGDTQEVWERERQLADGRRGEAGQGVVGKEPRHTTARKPGPLKSFNSSKIRKEKHGGGRSRRWQMIYIGLGPWWLHDVFFSFYLAAILE